MEYCLTVQMLPAVCSTDPGHPLCTPYGNLHSSYSTGQYQFCFVICAIALAIYCASNNFTSLTLKFMLHMIISKGKREGN